MAFENEGQERCHDGSVGWIIRLRANKPCHKVVNGECGSGECSVPLQLSIDLYSYFDRNITSRCISISLIKEYERSGRRATPVRVVLDILRQSDVNIEDSTFVVFDFVGQPAHQVKWCSLVHDPVARGICPLELTHHACIGIERYVWLEWSVCPRIEVPPWEIKRAFEQKPAFCVVLARNSLEYPPHLFIRGPKECRPRTSVNLDFQGRFQRQTLSLNQETA